jgi:hypothetical protein
MNFLTSYTLLEQWIEFAPIQFLHEIISKVSSHGDVEFEAHLLLEDMFMALLQFGLLSYLTKTISLNSN